MHVAVLLWWSTHAFALHVQFAPVVHSIHDLSGQYDVGATAVAATLLLLIRWSSSLHFPSTHSSKSHSPCTADLSPVAADEVAASTRVCCHDTRSCVRASHTDLWYWLTFLASVPHAHWPVDHDHMWLATATPSFAHAHFHVPRYSDHVYSWVLQGHLEAHESCHGLLDLFSQAATDTSTHVFSNCPSLHGWLICN